MILTTSISIQYRGIWHVKVCFGHQDKINFIYNLIERTII